MARNTQRTIEETIRAHLSGNAVDSVQVRDEVDNDGEPIFRITVILKKPLRSPENRREIIALGRHIRNATKDDHFPIIEFLTMSDARKRETA